MRVDILTPPRLGGPYYWAQNLAKVLVTKGIDARHVYLKHELFRVLARQKADIVHTTIPFPFGLCRKPMVLTVKGDFTIEHNAWQKFYPNTINHSRVTTIPSQYLKDKLCLDTATVIPNAVFPESFSMANQREQSPLRLTTICNMYFTDKTKGLLRLLNVLSLFKLSVKGLPFILTVVGDGAYRNHVEKAADELPVNFTGFIHDVRPILLNTNIFLYYSIHDNFPNVLLEAMASGLPVLTNRVGAVSEIIDHGEDGYVARDDGEYLNMLLRLVGDLALRKRIGLKARQTVEEKFDWHKIVERYVDIYQRIFELEEDSVA